MAEWLEDGRLGAFAVRVLVKIAEERAYRQAVLAALASADGENLSGPVG